MRESRTGRTGPRMVRSRGPIGSSGGGGGGSEPLLVGSVVTASGSATSPATQQMTFDVGASAGDLCVVALGTNYGISAASIVGGETVNVSAGNPRVLFYSKVLEAADITNGYVEVVLPSARGALITAVFTGGTFVEPADATTSYNTGLSSDTFTTLATPASGNSLSLLLTNNTNGSGPRYTTAATGFTEAGRYYYGTSNDASCILYYAWNATGSAMPAQTLTCASGPTLSLSGEWSVT